MCPKASPNLLGLAVNAARLSNDCSRSAGARSAYKQWTAHGRVRVPHCPTSSPESSRSGGHVLTGRFRASNSEIWRARLGQKLPLVNGGFAADCAAPERTATTVMAKKPRMREKWISNSWLRSKRAVPGTPCTRQLLQSTRLKNMVRCARILRSHSNVWPRA